MSHDHDLNWKFLTALVGIDEESARRVRSEGCPHCGRPLDRADYPRKPRGELGEAARGYVRRISLCCRACRRRATPPSVRFLGRKVYVGALVVIASVIGRSARLIGRGGVRDVRGVPVRTVRRWLAWWQVTFALSRFWGEARARFASPIAIKLLPTSLLDRFEGEDWLERALAFISPITTTSVRAGIGMVM